MVSMDAAKHPPARWTRLDWLLVAVLTLAAAWVRLGAAQLVPTLTDETDEIQFALRIAQGGFWPAVSVDPYNGPLHHYLLALGIALGGGATWPRLWMVTLGALTVGLTYALTRSLGRQSVASGQRAAGSGQQAAGSGQGSTVNRQSSIVNRVAGVIAGALLTVSFVPVVVNSHIAWSNASTPFWTTLALLLMSEARWRGTAGAPSGRWLVAAGGAAGLAVQTHPTALIPILGGALWLAVTRPAWLRTRWPWLALLAALLVVSNLIVYNIVTGGGSAEGAARRDYAFTGGVSVADYLANMRGFVGMAYQLVGSTFVSTLAVDQAAPALRAPVVVVYALTALVAVLVTVRRGGLPLACWLTALVLLPVINRAYDSHISARYMAPLLPPTFAALGLLLATPLAIHPRFEEKRAWRRWMVALLSLLLTAWLAAYPLLRLNEYYRFELADGRNNGRIWQILAAVREPGRQGTPVVLDRGLRDAKLDAGGHVYKALGTLLDLDRVPHTNPRVEELADTPPEALLVLTDARRDALAGSLRLVPVELDRPPAPAAPGGYWLYRALPP